MGTKDFAGRLHSLPFTKLGGCFNQMASLVNQGDRVVLTEHDAPVAVMIGMEEYEQFKAYLQQQGDADAKKAAGDSGLPDTAE